jgi:hypothetical protein
MNRAKRVFSAVLVVPLLVAASLHAARAAEADDIAAERARIAAARSAAEQRYVERERECQQRFVVTSCVEDARRERGATLSALRREQNLLDDRVRQARAAERRDELRERAESESARASAPRPPREAASHASFDRPGPPADPASKSPPQPHPVLKGNPGAVGEERRSAEQEARSRATFDAAQREAAQHRAEVEAKNASRAASGKKPAAPLPLPPGASGP